jgi:hypothetical protein
MQTLGVRSKGQATAPTKKQSVTLPKIDYWPVDPSLRQNKVKAEVRKGNVVVILPMVAQKARFTLERMPKYTQPWIGLDDLIAEGVSHATTTVLKAHKNNGEAGYVTYLWTSLDNLYADKLKEAYADKRYQKAEKHQSLDKVVGHADERELTLRDVLKSPKELRNEERIINRIDAERCFLRLYALSSPSLRRYLIMWILQPKNTKLKKYGGKFDSAAEELKGSKFVAPLPLDLCHTIWSDYECRRNICRAVCRKYRTPTSDSQTGLLTLRNSLEGMLVGIALGPKLSQLGASTAVRKV